MGGRTKNDADTAPPESTAGARAAPQDLQSILQLSLNYLPSGVSILGPDLKLIACNAKFRELLDLPDELFAQGLPTLPQLVRFNARRGDYGPGDLEKINDLMVERAGKLEPYCFERRRPNGVVLEIHGIPLPGGGYVTVYTDITERKQAELALRDIAEQLRLFADNVPSMTVSWDKNLRCRFANKRFADFFGFAVESLPGKHVSEVIGEEAYREVEGHLAQVLRGHPVSYQRLRKLPGGESRHIEIQLLPQIADDGKILGCYAVTTDITEQKRAEERIQHLAHHDNLTGLPNRLLFNDRLDQAISLAKRDTARFALLYLDLDKFKPVNDTLGHNAGDEVLRNAALRIRQQVRESDTIARVGGDEFTIILRDISSRDSVAGVAEKIIAALARPFHLKRLQQRVVIGASIGIGIYPDDAQDHEALLKLADAAMYSAKTRGSCFRFCEA